MGGKDAACALSSGEAANNCASVVAAHALVAEAIVWLFGLGRAADCHAEPRGKCLDGLRLEVVPRQIELGVVDSESTLGTIGPSQQRLHRLGHDPVVSPVLGVLEVHVRDPVVGKVVRHLACGAGGPLSDITAPKGCVLVPGYLQM